MIFRNEIPSIKIFMPHNADQKMFCSAIDRTLITQGRWKELYIRNTLMIYNISAITVNESNIYVFIKSFDSFEIVFGCLNAFFDHWFLTIIRERLYVNCGSSKVSFRAADFEKNRFAKLIKNIREGKWYACQSENYFLFLMIFKNLHRLV